MVTSPELDRLCVNTIRMLSADAVEKADSGHPGLPMEAAPIAYVLWTKTMRYNPKNPAWFDRDRFVLSAGHGSMLLYSMLHLSGYDLSLDELKNFRQWGSLTPGHPEYGLTPGVETTTGPLGQGISNAVGMAMTEAHLASRFNRPGHTVVDHYTYAIASDGDLMEGVASEACSLAGHLGLGKLIVLYTDNHISIEGDTALAFTESVGLRFDAYGWHVQRVLDGNDMGAIEGAITAAQRVKNKPSLIMCRTTIGYGSPNRAGTAKVHGEALGHEELRATKDNLGWPQDPMFYIPDEVKTRFAETIAVGAEQEAAWQRKEEAFLVACPDLKDAWRQTTQGELPTGWQTHLPLFTPDQGDMATRQASGTTLNALAGAIPNLLGGSADLAPSTNTLLKGLPDFQKDSYHGRNLHFGVREHGMGAILNGMMVHGGVIAYGATFLIFSDYMRPSIRLAALMEIAPIYVFTHDGIGLGEDGPTHQAVEHYMALRAIPHLTVIRPADANETAYAWRAALENRRTPTALLLTRQKLPILDRIKYASAEGLLRGAYVLLDAPGGKPDVILIASGSETHIAVGAAEKLVGEGMAVRVVSMPSWELFETQSAAYREAVLPASVTARLSIESGITLGWERYTGTQGDRIGVDRFGGSAPYKTIYAHFGLTTDTVAERVRALASRNS
ncbi:MAG: transketolase [candidate division Zixibacteria bacterium]|nr:transketolase [candidate division Zixibacteria bacterium]